MKMVEFGNYKFSDNVYIGNGQFGVVEKVSLYNSNNEYAGEYALKTFQIQDKSYEPYKEMFIERFKREAMALDACKHKHVVPVYIVNTNGDKPYFIMRLAETDLATELAQRAFSEEEKISVIKMILHGVKHIHDCNYLHRDIKPSNILKYSDGTYCVSDFGLIKDIDPQNTLKVLTQIGDVMGSGRYMAPEIQREYEYTYQTDIYAIGQVMEDLNFSSVNMQRIKEKARHVHKPERYNRIEEILDDIYSFELGVEDDVA